MTRLSIITPVYNAENSIESAMFSVSNQTYSNIEHIIVDGSSTDLTLKKIKKFNNPKSVIISEPDSGIYDAINKGIHKSTGEIIGIINSDDVYVDFEVISKVMKEFDDSTVDAIYGDLIYVSKKNPNKIVRFWKSGKLSNLQFRLGWMPPHPTVFVRRSVIDRIGLYDTKYQIAADYDFLIRCFYIHKISTRYIKNVLVIMCLGGKSNNSIRNILKKMYEDYKIVKSNKLGGWFLVLIKNLRKIKQFILN